MQPASKVPPGRRSHLDSIYLKKGGATLSDITAVDLRLNRHISNVISDFLRCLISIVVSGLVAETQQCILALELNLEVVFSTVSKRLS